MELDIFKRICCDEFRHFGDNNVLARNSTISWGIDF